MNISNLKIMVRNILRDYNFTRNDDIALTQKIWRVYYPEYIKEINDDVFINLKYLAVLPREDHIKRIRATIQNDEKMYLPTDLKVLLGRAKASDEWRKELGHNDWWSEYHWEKALKDYLKIKNDQQRLF